MVQKWGWIGWRSKAKSPETAENGNEAGIKRFEGQVTTKLTMKPVSRSKLVVLIPILDATGNDLLKIKGTKRYFTASFSAV